MRAVSFLLIAILITLILSSPAYAHDPFSVSGNVTDADGTPLAHVHLALCSPGRDELNDLIISSTIADANGQFEFGNIDSNVSRIRVRVFLEPPTGKSFHVLDSAWHEPAGYVVIPDNETRFTDYVFPDKGYIYGLIVRESDRMLMTGTVYLSNGKTFEVTSPIQHYLLETGPGNYTVYAVCYDEDGKRLASDKVDVQVLPAENKYDVPPLDYLGVQRVAHTPPFRVGKSEPSPA
jgi:hypothetical protein